MSENTNETNVSGELTPEVELQMEVEAEPSIEMTMEVEADPTIEMEMQVEIGSRASELNAEAWAVGQRGGVDVSSTDQTYHNNSKYWAEQAAAIVAGDIVDDNAGIGDLLKVWSADKDVKELDKKAPMIGDGVGTEASIHEIQNCADGMPMKVVVGIDPVQDLHGYDYPWIGGAGKNLADPSKLVMCAISTVGTDTEVDNPVYRTIKVDSLPAGTYTMKIYGINSAIRYLRYKYVANGSTVVTALSTQGESQSFTFETDVTGFACSFRKQDSSEITETVTVQIESGETATDFAPYENICPISGWTGCKITRTGKNLLGGTALRDGVQAALPSAVDTPASGFITFAANADTDRVYPDNNFARKLDFKENTQYTFILTFRNTGTTGVASNMRIAYTDGTYTNIDNASTANAKTTLVIVTDSAKTVKNFYKRNQSASTELYYNESGIFEGVLTAADFEPYQGNTYNIAFPAEAGTVYSGTLTVNKDGSGSLLVDKVGYALDELEFTYSSSRWGTAAISWIATPANNNQVLSGMMCSAFRARTANQVSSVVGSIAVSNNAKILLNVNGTNDTTAFDNAVDGQIIVIPLATAASYPLTPGQVKSLLGYNALWADTGNIKSLEYCADSKLYIEASIASAFMESVASVTETQEVINEYGSDE